MFGQTDLKVGYCPPHSGPRASRPPDLLDKEFLAYPTGGAPLLPLAPVPFTEEEQVCA